MLAWQARAGNRLPGLHFPPRSGLFFGQKKRGPVWGPVFLREQFLITA